MTVPYNCYRRCPVCGNITLKLVEGNAEHGLWDCDGRSVLYEGEYYNVGCPGRVDERSPHVPMDLTDPRIVGEFWLAHYYNRVPKPCPGRVDERATYRFGRRPHHPPVGLDTEDIHKATDDLLRRWGERLEVATAGPVEVKPPTHLYPCGETVCSIELAMRVATPGTVIHLPHKACDTCAVVSGRFTEEQPGHTTDAEDAFWKALEKDDCYECPACRNCAIDDRYCWQILRDYYRERFGGGGPS